MASPRNELDKLLQKEHEDALALLDANPFISGLLIKYAKGAPFASPDRDNEELIGLRFAYNSLRGDYANLQEKYVRAIDDAEHTKHATEVQRDEAAAAYSDLERRFNEALGDKERISKERDALQTSLEKAQADVDDVQVFFWSVFYESLTKLYGRKITKIRCHCLPKRNKTNKRLKKNCKPPVKKGQC
jgi:hypothetical protein